jgi:hypothetical protein
MDIMCSLAVKPSCCALFFSPFFESLEQSNSVSRGKWAAEGSAMGQRLECAGEARLRSSKGSESKREVHIIQRQSYSNPQCTPFTRVLRTAAPPYFASTSSCTFSIDLK